MEEVPPTIKTIEQFESFLRDYFLSNIPVELLSTEKTWFTIRIQSTYKKKEIAVFPKFDMTHPLFGENNRIYYSSEKLESLFNYIAGELNDE